MKKVYSTNTKETLSECYKYLLSIILAFLMFAGTGYEVLALPSTFTGTVTGTDVCQGSSTTIGLDNKIQDYVYYLFRIDESQNYNYVAVQFGITGVPLSFGSRSAVGKYVIYEFTSFQGQPFSGDLNQGALQNGEVYIFPIPTPEITGETTVCSGSEITYTTESVDAFGNPFSNYSWNVTGGTIASGGTSAENSISIIWGASGYGDVSVNYSTPGDECAASTATVLPVTIEAKPEFTGVTLQYLMEPAGIATPVNGTSPDFSMCLQAKKDYLYLDIDSWTGSDINAETLNPFNLDQNNLPTNWLSYWSGKDVTALAAAGSWQEKMYDIINGDAPIFYVYKTTGGDYQLIDGLMYQFAGTMVPLQISGDYPAGTYSYKGTVTSGTVPCESDEITINMEFNAGIWNSTQNKMYCAIEPAVSESADGDVIEVSAGTYVLTSQLTINTPITLNGAGIGQTIITRGTDWSPQTGDLGIAHLVGIGADNVTLSNLTVTGAQKVGTANGSGINVYEASGVVFINVESKNNQAAGFIINGSTATMAGVVTSGNGWYGVNVARGSGVTQMPSLTVDGTTSFAENAEIVADADIPEGNISYGYKYVFVGSEIAYNIKAFNLSALTYATIARGDVTYIYLSLQAAIDAAGAGETVNASAGTFAENIVLNKPVVLKGANADKACGGRVAESVIAPANGLPVSITADGVTINGFEITAPSNTYAINGSNTSDLNIIFNNIHDVGSSLTTGYVHAVVYQVASAAATSNVKINDNCFENIGNAFLTGSSASAVSILQSASTGVLTGLNIERNTIGNVTVNTGTGPTGKIAYGILINTGSPNYTTSDGKIVNAQIKDNTISNLTGFIATGIGLEGNTESAIVDGNTVSNLTGYKLVDRAGGGYNLQALKFESNRYVGTVTVANNSFQTETFTFGASATPNGLGYAVANYVPMTDGGIAELGCNWYGTANYGELVAEYTAYTGKIFNKDGAGTDFVKYSTTAAANDCNGLNATPANLSLSYDHATENVVVTFNVTGNSAVIYPIPGLDPTDPTDYAAIVAKYAALEAASTPAEVKAAALEIGDDIITEYYYLDGGSNKVYLQTAAGVNPLVKNKYWDQYLNNTATSDRYPDFTVPRFEVPVGTYSTWTNPGTGGTVNSGWLAPVYGKDLYVTVTLLHNGEVNTITEHIAIDPAPVVNLNTGLGYMQIQTAINDPLTLDGHTIQVAAGTYTENVVVDKAVTIEGPQKDVDPRTAAALRTSGSTAEAIVDGGGSSSPVFEITVAGVILNGLEITNGTGDLVSSPLGDPVKTGVTVKYCIVNSAGDEGIQLRNVDGGGVEYCYVYSTTGDGINLSSECTNSYIRHNEITTSASADAAIYLYSNGPDMLVDNNLISGVTSANGIMIGNKSGVDKNKNSSFTNNAIVSNNTIIGHAGSEVGIYVNTSRVNIIDNSITNWESSSDAALYLRWDIKDILVTGNVISGNENGIKVSSGVSAANALTFSINGNNLSDNTTLGLKNSSSGNVDATCNWWGSTDAYEVKALTSGDVQFLSFLVSDNLTTQDCSGVGPVTVWDGTYNTIQSSHMTINSALNTAVSGEIVEVAAGTYNYESEGIASGAQGLINVYKGVTIRAASGVRPIIDGTGVDGVFKIHPLAQEPGNTVIIEGFEISGDPSSGIAMTMQGCYDVTPAHIIIRDNWFHGMIGGIDFWGAGAYLPEGWTSAVANTEIKDNKFYDMIAAGGNQGFGILIESPVDWSAFNEHAVKIENNEFLNLASDGSNYGTGIGILSTQGLNVSANVSISGNSFTSDVPIGVVFTNADVAHTEVSGNSFETGMFGIYATELSNSPLTATCNWWGTPDGDAISTLVSSDVDVSSWLVLDGAGATYPWSGSETYSCDGTPVIIEYANPDHITCGETTGSISLKFSGGSPTYAINWGSGAAGVANTDEFLITNLGTGEYLVTVTDINGSSAAISTIIKYLPVSNTTQTKYYATIQEAIDDAEENDVIEVCAGTYAEAIVVDKPLDIRGPNYGNAGNSSRNAEAIIVPPSELNATASPREWSEVALVTLSADNIKLDGFTISGDNPDIDGYSYAGMNVEAGLGVVSEANNVVFQNNIVEKFTYMGFYAQSEYGDPRHFDITVTQNKFSNIHDINQLGYGFAMYIQGTTGSINNNTVVNSRTGIQVQPYTVVQSGATAPDVNSNSFSVWRNAIYYNYAELGASAWTITQNNITACNPPVNPTGPVVWEGISAETMRETSNGGTISTNTINGSGAATDGVKWWNVRGLVYKGNSSYSTLIAFTNNSVSNVEIGLVHSANADIVLTGNTISATAKVISVQHNYSSAGVEQANGGANNVDATGGNTFNGVATIGASDVQLFAIEDAIDHKIDESSRGLVTVTSEELFVTENSFAGAETVASIQRGIDAASSGWTVNVGPGSFTEQLEITKPLTLLGHGVDITNIVSPDVLALSYTTSAANKPVIYVHDATDVVINRITLDGDGKGNLNYRFQGIAFWNASGSVLNSKVIDVTDTPFSGNQHGVGIYAFNNTPASSYNVVLNNVEITGFQKNAVALNGTGNLTVDVDNITATGAGPTAVTAQNGIQVWGGSGTIDDCEISDIAYTSTGWTASGLLINGPGTVTANNVNIDNCQTSAYWYDADGTYQNSAITNPLGDALYGHSVTGSHTLNIQNVSAIGTNAPDSWGISALTEGSPMNMNISNCDIQNWNYGIYALDYEVAGGVLNTIGTGNNLSNNTIGFATNAATTQTATCNWWGTVDGNDIAIDLVEGDVAYSTWLVPDAAGDAYSWSGSDKYSCDGSPIVITLVNSTEQTCDDMGTITIEFSGGIGPYDISWNGGSDTDVSGPSYTTPGLEAGIYNVTITDDNGTSVTEPAINVGLLPVKNTTGPVYFATINAAITAAADGDIIELCAGNYTETLNVNKNLTINGPNVGIDPNGGSRVLDEAVILDGKINITYGKTVVVDGIKIRQTNDVTPVSLGGSDVATIQNVIIERFGINPGVPIRGIEISAGSGLKNIKNNLFTGDVSGGLYSGHKTWNSGMYVNAGGSTINILNNVYENCRTAINIDDMVTGVAIIDNTFSNCGTYLSFGGTSPTTGIFTLGANEFKTAVGAVINLSNVATSFRLDVSAGTYEGTVFSALPLDDMFNIELRTYHRGRYSRNGLVTYVINNLYAVNYTGTGGPIIDNINTAISYASAGNIINLQDGSFNQRVVVDKSLTIDGQSQDGTILDGTGLIGAGSGIYLNNGVTNVTIKDLTVQNFAGTSPNSYAGIYAFGGNNNLSVLNTTLQNNIGGSGFYANGPITDVLLDEVTASGHTNVFGAARGIVIWNGLKSNITITNCEVFNNNCCGIELQDGTASGVTMSNNQVYDNGDSGMSAVGLMAGNGANVISNNTLSNNGRFGIEIKNPDGNGTTSGDGSIVVSGNNVSMTSGIADLKDMGGILVFRRGVLAGNVDIPTGVVVQNNTVSGYVQASTSEGFGIVVEGTNHTVTGNTLDGNDVGIQQQAGHTPYPADGDQSNIADLYFGRGNSPELCGVTVSSNTFSSNGVNERIVTGGGTGTEQVAITPSVNNPGNQLLCEGESSVEVDFTGNYATGVVYEWTNDNTSIGLNASGVGDILSFVAENTSGVLQIANITVVPVANGCEGASESFSITVRPEFTAGSIETTGESVVYLGDPGVIGSAVVASGGDEAISYQWQSSINGVDFNDITSANDATYNPPVLNQTTWFKRLAKDGTCNTIYTESDGIWIVSISESDAITWLQANTTLTSATGDIDDLTAAFPDEIPPVIVAGPYKINSRMTLAGDPIPAGSKVDIWLTVDGGTPFLYADDALIPGTSFWVTDLVGGTAADFDAGYEGRTEFYSITINNAGGNPIDLSGTVLVESIISNDGFVTQTVLDEKALNWNLPDAVAPELVEVTPAEGAQCLEGNSFVWTVKAQDANLYELEIDHSMAASMPEFSVYASETDPYGGDGALFAAAGVSVIYDSGLQQWTIDFGADLTQDFIDNGGITFYVVLKDLAGNQWGTMYGTTPENTFVYTMDNTAPVLVSVTPAEGAQCLLGNSFVWTVQASDDNLYSLEIDHSMEGTLPEFTVYASTDNPYGTPEDKTQFEAAGVTVIYDAGSQRWTIDFGQNITNMLIANGGITLYAVLEDCNGNQWGTMYGTAPENTFIYTFDKEVPLITLTGESTVNICQGDQYTDDGASAFDNCDGNLTSAIVVYDDNFDANTPGSYVFTYNVTDLAGNLAVEVIRNVIVEAIPVAGTLAKLPDTENVCDPSIVSAVLTSGTGGNGSDELDYSIDGGTIWNSYIAGEPISTVGLNEVKIRTRRMADYCNPSEYEEVSWLMYSTEIVSGDVGGTLELTYCDGRNPLAFNIDIVTGGDGNYTYQWEESVGCTDTWVNATAQDDESTTTLSFNPPVLSGISSMCYRLKITDGCGNVGYSNIKTYIIVPDPVSQEIVQSTEGPICVGDEVSATFTGGNGGTGEISDVYEYSIDGGTNWNTYTSGASITATEAGINIIQVRTQRLASGVSCDDGEVNIATWTVNPEPEVDIKINDVIATYGYSAEFCYGENIAVELGNIVSGVGPIDLAWEVFVDGNTTADVTLSGNVSAVTAGYELFNDILPAGVYELELISLTDNNGCSPLNISAYKATIIINPLPTATIEADQTKSVCSGIPANIEVDLTGTGPWDITYTDGTNTFNVEDIPSSPYIFAVSPLVNTSYEVTSVTDANGCTNTGTGSARIYIGPITTIVSVSDACPGGTITVPVTVESFDEVGTISLTIKYDLADLDFQSGTINSDIEISNLVIIDKTNLTTNPEPGVIKIGGYINENEVAQSLADGEELCSITFTYIGDVAEDGTVIVFDDADDDAKCEYGFGDSPDFTAFCDDPTSTYYINGSVSEDAIAPVAVCQNITVDLDATGNASIVAAQVDNGSSDNCAIASMSVTPNTFDCSNVGTNAVTLTVTDLSGNSSSCAATVTVQDVTPPNVTTQNISVDLDASGNATITASDVDGGSTDNCGIDSKSVSPSAFTCANIGINPVILTVTDVNGISSSADAQVTVIDATPPNVVTQNISVNLDASGNASITASEVNNGSSDACGIASMIVSPSAFTCSDVGANSVTLTVTDVNGNSSSAIATVTVTDADIPSITCPVDVTIQVNASSNPSETGFATATDNCTADPVIAFTDVWTPGSCVGTGTITRIWTATDESSNEATCEQIITVIDTETPAITCPSDIVTVNDAGVCGADVTFDDPVSYDHGYVESYDVTNYVSGEHGGWHAYNSDIIPVVSGYGSINAASGAGYGLIQSAGLSQTGIYNRLGAYNTEFGNGYRIRQAIYMDLNDPEVIANTYGWDLSAASNNQAGTHLRDFIFHTASNSAGEILVAGSNNSNGTRRNDLAKINHWTITSSGWYIFEWVFRNEAGVLAVDLNLCDAGGAVLWTETRSDANDLISTVVGGNRYLWFTFLEVENLAIDNTSIERVTTITSDYASGSTFPVGTTEVTYTSTDACGNPMNCSFNVTVNDEQAPVITLSGDATVEICQNEIYTDAGATASDVCDGDITGSIVTVNPVNTGTPGIYTVTYNVKDAALNSAVEVTRTVTVNALPVVSAVSMQTSIDESSWSTVDGDLTGGYTMCVDPAEAYHYFDINTLGSTEALLSSAFVQNAFYLDETSVPAGFLTYWDDKGVNASATSGWEAVMYQIITGAQPMFYISWDGTDYTLVDGLMYQYASVEQTLRISGDYPAGDYVFAGTVTDVNGCVSEEFDVKLHLNSAPVITCPADITVSNDAGVCGASVEFEATATGVPAATIVYTLADNSVITSPHVFPVGTTTVTATASNLCKTVSCSFNVTVNDEQAPVITLLGDATVEICQNEIYTDAGATASDVCDGDITGSIVTVNPVNTGTPGIYTVTYNVKDAALNSAVEVTRTVTVNALPVVSAVSMQTSIDESSWSTVDGDLTGGYTMCVDPAEAYHYFDIDALTSTEALLSSAFVQNAFYLDETSVPAGFLTYWDDKGVNASATSGTWQAVMWDIINGNAPMFYISWDGTDYALVDGLMYQYASVEQTLRISGDYPAGDYVFEGTVTDVNGCVSLPFNVNLHLNSAPVITCPADITVGNDAGVCGASVEFEATATGVPAATIVYTLADNSVITSPHVFPVGTTTVTATASNLCKTVSCSFNVTVNDTEDPTVSCPSTVSYFANNGCTWTGAGLEPTIGDNCSTPTLEYSVDGGVTFELGDANGYDFPKGTTTVTYKVTDASGNIAECSFDVVVNGAALSGVVTYYNTANTKMSNTIISLQQGGSEVYSTTTAMDGSYSFANICPGTYQVVFTTAKPVGGINAGDAAQVNAWQLSPYSIEKVRFLAGDVKTPDLDGNLRIKSNDAGAILDYFVFGDQFDKPWEFWKTGESVSGNPQPNAALEIVIPQPSVTPAVSQDFYALVSGDFNRSFAPDLTKAGLLGSESVTLLEGDVVSELNGETIDLPVKPVTAMEVGAISLILNYPADELQIENVFLRDMPEIPVQFNAANGELRIGWYSENAISMAADETMLTVRVKLTSDNSFDEALYFKLANDPLIELADGACNVIADATLTMDGIKLKNGFTTGVDMIEHNPLMDMTCYPNPFNEKATIKYVLPEDGRVHLEVIGLLGNRINLLANEQQIAGEYLRDLDGVKLVSGVYQVTLRFTNQRGEELVKTIRMIKR